MRSTCEWLHSVLVVVASVVIAYCCCCSCLCACTFACSRVGVILQPVQALWVSGHEPVNP